MVPWGFRRFFQLAYGRTHYGTGYQVLSRYPEGATNLSRPVTRLSRSDRRDIARLLARAGQDLAPARLPRHRGRLDVRGGTHRVVALRGRNRVVRALQLSAPEDQALSLGRLRLRIRWDGRRAPSVDAPLDLLFGAVAPTWEATGRVNRGVSQFTLRSLPRHRGLLLRRTLDQGYPDPDARVLVRHCAGGRCRWRRVGRWFTPGSSRVVFSFPPGELDPPEPEIRDDGRRFKDSELLISPRYTRGRRRLTFRIVPRLRPRPLVPGESPFPSAWTEFRYTLYAYRLPSA